MPLGEEPQGAVYGNPAEEHESAWEPNEWESLGYTCTEVHDRVLRTLQHLRKYKSSI
jgi:hypothetical protein